MTSKRPHHPKVVVSLALLVCCAMALAIYSTFPSRPPIRQPSLAPDAPVPSAAPLAAARDAETGR